MASLLVQDTDAAPHETLSDREFLILRLIASGKAVSVIARELSLSVKTVSTYRGRLLEKMGLTNNAQIVHYAFQNNLVERPNLDLPVAPTSPAPPAIAPSPKAAALPSHARLARIRLANSPSRPPTRRPFNSP